MRLNENSLISLQAVIWSLYIITPQMRAFAGHLAMLVWKKRVRAWRFRDQFGAGC